MLSDEQKAAIALRRQEAAEKLRNKQANIHGHEEAPTVSQHKADLAGGGDSDQPRIRGEVLAGQDALEKPRDEGPSIWDDGKVNLLLSCGMHVLHLATQQPGCVVEVLTHYTISLTQNRIHA